MNPSQPQSPPSDSKGVFQGAVEANRVKSAVQTYETQFSGKLPVPEASGAAEIAREYYQLATDLYEFGWGQSFHFAPRRLGESVAESLLRYEQEIADKLGLRRGMRALDVGCGVGGPMRNISRHSGAAVTGISITPYHVERATKLNRREGLAQLCEAVEGDFNALPFASESFDSAFTLDACCHAQDRRGPFREVFRTLKPGGLFVGSDWCMTDRYRRGDPQHQAIKHGIEKGDGISNLVVTSELDAALRDSGFEILEAKDLAETGHPRTPWYAPLASGWSLRGFRNSRTGAFLTHQLVRFLESVHLSPKGMVQVHDVLRLAQSALVEGGKTRIFTPLYFWVARKPA